MPAQVFFTLVLRYSKRQFTTTWRSMYHELSSVNHYAFSRSNAKVGSIFLVSQRQETLRTHCASSRVPRSQNVFRVDVCETEVLLGAGWGAGRPVVPVRPHTELSKRYLPGTGPTERLGTTTSRRSPRFDQRLRFQPLRGKCSSVLRI